ncbi:CHAP domain-containing protein [Nonomuraea aurantiaca]|uniref:CHAP domain-containing protein n=1 Tax=Nonomuraea aurantiaca TaxID=2878562 RepID=UPI001CD9D326|nr:CHAP domain-containing protein [Nonomuraea aurantiaca]MCA2220765.1 FG-GAP-like repeat-containing protein [Nonomuraea aurantiaca]
MTTSTLLRRLSGAAVVTALAGTGLIALTAAPAAAVSRAGIVSVAQSQLGNASRNHEDPAGSGCNYYTGYFRPWKPASGCASSDGVQWRNSDWCADFSKYVWKNAGVPDAEVDETNGGVLTGWASSFKDYGTKHGTWHARSTGYAPQPGDAVVFDWDQSGDIDHVGIVKSSNAGTVYTIEGNSGNRIKENSYARTNIDIVGYSAPVGAETGPPATPADASGTSDVRADFNGDGLEDVAAFYDYPGARTVLFVWSAKAGGGFNAPVSTWDSGAGNFEQPRAKAVAGDFNGDGLGDVGTFYDYPGARTALWIWTAKAGGGFNAPVNAWDSGAGNFEQPRAKAVAGDFNGDGLTDVGTFYDYPGARTALWIWTAKAGGGFNAPTNTWDSGAGNFEQPRLKPVAGDFNGDGLGDVGGFYDYPGARTVLFVWSAKAGGGFNAPVSTWDSGAGNFEQPRAKAVAGDFNGDKLTDVGTFYDYSGARTALWIWTAKAGGGFNVPTNTWDSGAGNFEQPRAKPVTGDFNGDGHGDIGTFYDYPGGRTALWVWTANTSSGFNAPTNTWDSGAGNWDQFRTKPV